MNEPISFRPVTDLEEVEALDDGAYIVVIENGTAKRISKANANFGGGVTKYVARDKNSTATITHEDGSAVTPQEAYDAFMSGPVILEIADTGFNEEAVVSSLVWLGASSTTVVGVVLNAKRFDNSKIQIKIGETGE